MTAGHLYSQCTVAVFLGLTCCNNNGPVHLLLPQSHLSPTTFHANSTSRPDHFRCDSFLRFSHFPATLFRWDNNPPALCGSRFLRFDPACGSHPLLPFEGSDGPCGPRFLPPGGETIRPERRILTTRNVTWLRLR